MEGLQLPTAKASPTASQKSGGVKDTIESILVAFILAFVFRAFVVEAFVIPTGSMAPTLMGAHMRYTCGDCGYDFTVNFPGTNDGVDINIPSSAIVYAPVNGSNQLVATPKTYSIYCPNCGYKIPKSLATGQPVHYGDRILVLKYLYLFQEPQRWDVVVFKAPVADEPDGMFRYQTNYIKRLIGKPGESIMVLDGDVYIAPPGIKDLKPGDFVVQTKPRKHQDALWRIVYDDDFYPRGLQRADGSQWRQPWSAKSNEKGWNVGTSSPGARVFHFDNPSGSAALRFNPAASPNAHPLSDWLAYDQVQNAHWIQGPKSNPDTFSNPPYSPDNNVSDLRLSFFYSRSNKNGSAPIRLQMTKLDHLFTAEIYPDHARLLMQIGTESEKVLIADTPIKLKSTSKIDFQNVDYQVSLRVDDDEVFKTEPQQYAPDVAKLLEFYRTLVILPKPEIRIIADRQTADFSHVSLWRDIYYTNRADNMHWAKPDDFPNEVARLNNDEYFVMGDNSPVSGDARYWPAPVKLPDEDLFSEAGRVPGRFLLGKAFFVYWPAGYRPLPSGPSFVPNFGDMRFIH